MTQKAEFFAIHELVPPSVFKERGEKAWELLDCNAVITLDALRRKFGRITVNDYGFGGEREWSGLRTAESPYGTQYSQHRFGRAFDCLFHETDVNDAREYILKHPEEFPFITSIELGTSWLHFDTRNCEPIKTYYPN